TTTLTSGSAYVTNKCGFTVYLWSVSSVVGSLQTIPNGATYSERFRYDPLTGIAIKIGTNDRALYTGAPLLHFNYALNPSEGSIYYDLSTVFGFDYGFRGRKFTLKGTEGKNVPSIEWSGGAPSGTRAYFGDTDLTLTLC
ncbi:uncharacterized protein EI97DRAFT_353482, partial [Westerdykella ornata]